MSIANSNSPFRHRGFLIASAVLVVIALLAVIALVSGLFGGGGDDVAPTTAPTSATSEPAAEADSDPSVCGLEGYETTSSLTAAPDNKWELVGTIAVPASEGVGPGVIEDDGFRYCYSHTAEGALFAAANAGALGSDATYRARMYELAAPGPGREAAMQQSTSAQSSSARIQYAGFAVLAYDGDSATIDLAINRSSDGQLLSFPIKLEWAEGDWKLVVTNEGQQPLAPSPIESLGGYIPWSGA